MLRRVVSTILFCASFLLAQSYELDTPQKSVNAYYIAVNSADIALLKSVMTPDSFDTDMQIYALSIALKDKSFHQQLKAYNTSVQAKELVIKKVQEKLKHRPARSITIDEVVSLGERRVMVQFHENGKKKQLYLSQENDKWIIDYLAGRKR
jgi:hypothetical protein